MFRVYLLESLGTSKWYVGYTPVDPLKRLVKHNRGDVKSTKAYKPWRLIYVETYLDRSDAVGRKKLLKSGSGRIFWKRQLKNYLSK
jgi:putative endonuclease